MYSQSGMWKQCVNNLIHAKMMEAQRWGNMLVIQEDRGSGVKFVERLGWSHESRSHEVLLELKTEEK